MNAKVTALGNEGFEVDVNGVIVLFDPFFRALPGVAFKPWRSPSETPAAHFILITHSHWDHFNDRAVAEAARRTDAKVVGPASVIENLQARVAEGNLIQLEPAAPAGRQVAAQQTVNLVLSGQRGLSWGHREDTMVSVTAFRTFHSRDHNSYLIDVNGFRMFHDGDNEDTHRLDLTALAPIDALFIGPWQGSGWVEFVEAIRPRKWFLMHLDDGELDQHERGEYLPELCTRIPPNLVVLRPGQSFEM